MPRGFVNAAVNGARKWYEDEARCAPPNARRAQSVVQAASCGIGLLGFLGRSASECGRYVAMPAPADGATAVGGPLMLALYEAGWPCQVATRFLPLNLKSVSSQRQWGRSREVPSALYSRSSRASSVSPPAHEGIRGVGAPSSQRPCDSGQPTCRAHPPIEPARDQGPTSSGRRRLVHAFTRATVVGRRDGRTRCGSNTVPSRSSA